MYTLPTMNKHGLVKDKNIQVKDIFKYFITTQQSQSTIYSNHIESYDYIMKRYSKDENILRDKITNSLTRLYKRYFSEVEIRVVFDKHNKMGISINVKDNEGKLYMLNHNDNTNIITEIDDIVNLYK